MPPKKGKKKGTYSSSGILVSNSEPYEYKAEEALPVVEPGAIAR
jgi:hypothetical protein